MCATPRRLKKNVTRLVTIRNMARYKNYKPLSCKTAARGSKKWGTRRGYRRFSVNLSAAYFSQP